VATLRIVALGVGAGLLARVASPQTPGNLLRNSDFEHLFLVGGAADGWRAGSAPPGVENAARLGAGIDGGICHVISAADAVPINWYQCAQSLGALPPGGRFTLSAYVRTENVRDGAGAYLGVNYFGSRGDRISWTDTARRLTGTTDWTRLSQAFTVPGGTTEVSLNLVLHGHGTAFFDRAQVEVGDEATAWRARETPLASVPLPLEAAFRPSTRGNVALLRDTIPATGVGSDPAYLRSLIEQAGYGCAYLNADLLADPSVLSASRFDLLVLPYGASFPVAAAESVLGFSRDGGSLFTFGGYPFDRLLYRQDGVWKDVADVTPDETKLTPLFDLSAGPAGWVTSGREVPQAPAQAGDGRRGRCLKLATDSLAGWVSASSPRVESSVAQSRVTAFHARADQDDVTLAFEWDEKDGSRWRSKVKLTREWRLYAIAHAELEYWPDNPSKGRGHPGDRFHPENAAWLSFGLTQEFLKGGEPYAVYIDDVLIGDDPFPAYRNVWLNSRYGGVNPATFLEPSPAAISICDPSAPLTDVARLAASPDQTVLPADWGTTGSASGFSATGQTAQGRAGAPLKARWIPVVDCLDRYGRLRGTALAVMHNFAGEYAGSSWAYSAIADRDLFPKGDAAGADLFRGVLDRVMSGAFLFNGQGETRCIRRGEKTVFPVCVGNLARAEREVSIRLAIHSGDRVIAEQVRNLRLPARRAEPLRFDWEVPRDAPAGLLVLRWELLEGARVLDRLEAGVVVWDAEQLGQGPKLSYRECYFSRGHGPEFLLGTQVYWGNATVTGTDPLRWDRQFAEMADNGIHIARSFMSMPWMNEPEGEAAWRPRDAMVQLAQAHGIALFYSGVSWPTTDPSEVTQRAKVATEAARRYEAVPGWFVDIVNEPSLRIGEREADAVEFREYLKDRYPSFDALRAAWGDELTETSFDEIRIAPMEGGWTSVRAIDTNRFMSYAMRRWTAETARAAHAGDPARLVSVGHLQGFGDTQTMWDPIEASYDMDFANRHYYGPPLGYGPELAQTDLRTLGKAPSTGEFGGTSHPGLTTHGVYAPEETINWNYAYLVHTCFGLGGAFASNWHWQDPIEDIFPCGVLLADGVPRPRFYTYRNLGFLFRQIRPRYDPPELFLVIPTSHRFGMSKAAVEAAMNRGLAALISLHVTFCTVAEENLASLPPAAKALVWPVPFCPDDAAYRAVLAFVRKGGALYLSGDVSYDPLRRRSRAARLPELCGVEYVSERYPNIAYAPDSAGIIGEANAALAAALREAKATSPCVVVRPTSARVLATAGDAPLATLTKVGEGKVLYVTDPVELHAEPTAILAAFLQEAGVRRHAIDPDLPAIHSHRVPGEKGAMAQVLFNLTDQVQRVPISDLPARLELELPPKWGGAAIFSGSGALVALEARAAKVDGRPLLAADSSVCLISLTGEDLRQSHGLLILPSGPGEVRLDRQLGDGWSASVGEVRGGRWAQYEKLKLAGGRLRLDGAMGQSLILLAPEADLAQLGGHLVADDL